MKDFGGTEIGAMARDCLLMRTRLVSRVVTSIYDEALRPFGIVSPQFALLKHTFSAPLIKIARARKHLAELEEEIGVFLSTEPARLRRRVVSGTPEPPLQLRIVLPPEHLGAIIGDIVHNLRARRCQALWSAHWTTMEPLASPSLATPLDFLRLPLYFRPEVFSRANR
jgi:hypothetical protein